MMVGGEWLSLFPEAVALIETRGDIVGSIMLSVLTVSTDDDRSSFGVLFAFVSAGIPECEAGTDNSDVPCPVPNQIGSTPNAAAIIGT